jgi:hypothetical protein
MTKEQFIDKFNELGFWGKLALYNEYIVNTNSPDPTYHKIGEDFFVENFDSFMELAEKIGDRGINMDNDIIFFDNFGDLETLSYDDTEEVINEYVDDIYKHEEVWENYI